MQQKSSKGCNVLWLILFSSFIGSIIYLQLTFPHQIKNLWPQKFQSHPARDISHEIKNLVQMDPFLFNEIAVGICQDIQVDNRGNIYCVNELGNIISINTETKKLAIIGKMLKGKSFGIRLSKDEQFLYINNAEMGLCEFDFETGQVSTLVSQYQGQFLVSLNSVEVHPTNPNIIYITQTNDKISMDDYHIDIILNNPLGKLFEFNKQTKKLTLITDGLYFPNGIIFQIYRNQETVLVAQTNRFRLLRIYLNGQSRGKKQVAVDKLDFYLDNMKANEKGEIWVGGPTGRDHLLAFADRNPWLRRILSRFPAFLIDLFAQPQFFGGSKIVFFNSNEDYKVEYYLWQCLRGYKFGTTVLQRNSNLFISSLKSAGIWYIQKFNDKLQDLKSLETKKKPSGQDL